MLPWQFRWGMLVCKVAFSLGSSINLSACSTLDPSDEHPIKNRLSSIYIIIGNFRYKRSQLQCYVNSIDLIIILLSLWSTPMLCDYIAYFKLSQIMRNKTHQLSIHMSTTYKNSWIRLTVTVQLLAESLLFVAYLM